MTDSMQPNRAAGGHWLVIPETFAWWLGHYGDLHEYLIQNSRPAIQVPMAHMREYCVN